MEHLVNLERYHVMSESEILQRLNGENTNSSRCYTMMAWGNLEEPINENKMMTTKIHLRMKNISTRTQKKKKLMMNTQKHLLPQIMFA